MAQTPEGALKVAAANAGVTVDDYQRLRASGLKRCTGCKQWTLTENFNVDLSRGDGLCAKGRCCSRVNVRVDRSTLPSNFKGRSHTAAARAAMSDAKRGKPSARLGVAHTLETRAKISEATRLRTPRGVDAPGYVDGKGAERFGLRHTAELKQWRYDVYMRDSFTCRHCLDDRGGNLHAHHILPFATHPEGRFDIDNGLTLCEPCHKRVHRLLG